MQSAQHPYVISLYSKLGKAYLGVGDLSESKKAIDLASNFNKIDTLQFGLNKNSSTDNVLDKPLLVSTLKLKAEFLYKSMQKQGSASADEILEIYSMCDLLIGEIRSSHLKYSDKVAFGKVAVEVYKRAVKACLEHYEGSKDKVYLQKAFDFVQKAKSSVLAENLNDQFAKQFSGVDEELIRVEEALKIDLSYYQTKINEIRIGNSALDTAQLRNFESLIFSAGRSLDSARKSIEADYPDYFALKHK